MKNLKFKTSVMTRVYYGVPRIKRKGTNFWTQKELVNLIEAYNSNMNPVEIANYVGNGRTASACMGKINQLRREQNAIEATVGQR